MSHVERNAKLREQLTKSFTWEQLEILCYDLVKEDFEDLEGRTKNRKALSLIIHMQQQGRMHDLIAMLKSNRPNIDWDTLYSLNEEDKQPFCPPTLSHKTSLPLMFITSIMGVLLLLVLGIWFIVSKNDNDTIAKQPTRVVTPTTVKLATNPSAFDYYQQGNSLYDESNYDAAIKQYTQAIKLNLEYAAAYFKRGNAYKTKGEYDLAIADYTQALSLDVTYKQAYLGRGLSYYYKKEYDLAIADYDHAIALDTTYKDAYTNRGNAYRVKEEYDLAIADYDHAIALDATYKDAYINRGNAYRAKGEYDFAIADYDQTLVLDANYTYAYYGRGLSYKLKGDYDKAIADFRMHLELEDDESLREQTRNHLRELGAKP